MAKWEYCRIFWMVREVSDDAKQRLQKQGFEGNFVEANNAPTTALLGYLKFLGSSHEPKPITDLGSEMAQLGIEGWELVSHTQIQVPTPQEVFHFKRQIQG